jgi:hypothetical protein
MKHIKLFEDFYGNNLWSDTSYPERSYDLDGERSEKIFVDYIQRMYDSSEFEKNTRKEDQLLQDVEEYLIHGDKRIKRSAGLIKKLLKYKALYPEMLDPSQSIRSADLIFRGMTMGYDEIHDLIDNCDRIVKLDRIGRSQFNNKVIVLKGARKKIKSRQNIGFISASTRFKTAFEFSASSMEGGRWPVVVAASFGKIESKCIMNPDFLNALNDMDESETWILGNEIESEDVYVLAYDPTNHPTATNGTNPEYAKIINRIWGLWEDDRIKQGK